VALEAQEESPLAVAARQVTLAEGGSASPAWQRTVMLAGIGVMIAAFVGTAAWVRSAGPPPRPLAPSRAVAPLETEVDRLLARASERIDAHDEGGAEEAAMRAAAVDPSDPRALLLLARIHLRRGQPDRARTELNRVLDLEASGPRAEEARALLSTIP
jgi:cytochrome c-type biogenesis protein CcmH/NrfG